MDLVKSIQNRIMLAPDAPTAGIGTVNATAATSPAAEQASAEKTTPDASTTLPAGTAGKQEPLPKHELTQKEIDALVAGAKREGSEKVWQKNGFANEKEFDDFIKAAKAEADAKKSEVQREKERADKAESEKKMLEERANKAEAKAEALALGVPPDKAEDLVVLAMAEDGETITEKVKVALEKRPWFKDQSAQVPNLGAKVKNQTSGDGAIDAELEKIFGKHIGT